MCVCVCVCDLPVAKILQNPVVSDILAAAMIQYYIYAHDI